MDPAPHDIECPECAARNAVDSVICAACGAWLTEVPPVGPGTILNKRYEVQDVLGTGGMGTVFRAYDRHLDETCAVKVLRADLAASEDMARRFRTEIKLARRVRHHNVCGIHEYQTDGPLNYISMELIQGTDLKHLIRKNGALPVVEAFNVCIQIAEGLQAIHDAGIIHRDLKTSNVMLDGKGRAVLMDFGIAKDTQQSLSMAATAVGQIIGTPEYMSPEQARGERIDARSDLYALGIIIFEVFSSDVPFRGATPIATLFKTLEQPPPLDGPEAASIPRSVIPILARALAKGPAERFQSASEMAQALRAARDEAFGGAVTPAPRTINLSPGQLARAPVTPTPPTRPPAPPTPPPPPVPAAGDTPTTFTPPVAPPTRVPGRTDVSPPTLGPMPATMAGTALTPIPPPSPAEAAPRRTYRPATVPPPRVREGMSPGLVLGAALLFIGGTLALGWVAASRLMGPGPTVETPPTLAPPPTAAPPPGTRSTPVPAPVPTPLPTIAATPLPTPMPAPTAAPTPLPSIARTPLPTLASTPLPPPTRRAPPPSVTNPVATMRPAEPTRPPTPAPRVPAAAPASARLQLRVKPWAEVHVDGRLVGTTPFAPLTLGAGTHTIEFVHPNYKPVRRKISLEPGETGRLELDMTLDAVPK